MKKLGLILLLSAFFLAFFALAQSSGTVEGEVLNGSAENKPISGITVTLHIFDSSGTEKGTLTALTDEQGYFAFKGLDTGKDLFYLAEVNFQGVLYHSSALSFTEGEEKLRLPVVAYETTESDSEIAVQKAHFIFAVAPDRKTIEVMEMYSVVNNGRKTFVTKDGKTLRFPIPPEAMDFVSDSLNPEGGEAVLTEPILPGPMPQPLTLGYVLPVRGDSLEIRRIVFYPVESYNVLVKDIGLTVEVPGTKRGRNVETAGDVYLNFEGEKLPKGGEITVKLSGLEKASKVQVGETTWVLATTVAVVLALLGLFLVYLRRR
jgi:hypothetical protein